MGKSEEKREKEKVSNLYVWDQVEKTDPDYTKPITAGAMKGKKSISGMYFVNRATELFGPIGKKWGYEIIEERLDEELPITDGEGTLIGMGKTHTIKLLLWWKDDDCEGDQRYEVTNFGHTPYMYRGSTANYTTVDKEAPKKSLTDALKKCLSMLGIGADVYLGLFDDEEYAEERQMEAEIEKSDDKAAKKVEQRQAYEEEKKRSLHLIRTGVSLNELEQVFKSIIRKANRFNDTAGIRELTEAKDDRKKEISNKQSEE